jgi:hypothetical protein
MKKYYVVFKKDNKIEDLVDPETIEDVSSHDTFADANWAYVEVRKANPTKLAGIISIGEDNIPRMTTMRVVVLHNEDGTHDFIVRGKDCVDVHLHAKDDVEMMEAYKTSLRMKEIS